MTLWQTLRRQVREGDAVGAEATAISLGYTKSENRRKLLDNIHARIRKNATAAQDLADVRAELEKPPAQATPKRATDKQSPRHR